MVRCSSFGALAGAAFALVSTFAVAVPSTAAATAAFGTLGRSVGAFCRRGERGGGHPGLGFLHHLGRGVDALGGGGSSRAVLAAPFTAVAATAPPAPAAIALSVCGRALGTGVGVDKGLHRRRDRRIVGARGAFGARPAAVLAARGTLFALGDRGAFGRRIAALGAAFAVVAAFGAVLATAFTSAAARIAAAIAAVARATFAATLTTAATALAASAIALLGRRGGHCG